MMPPSREEPEHKVNHCSELRLFSRYTLLEGEESGLWKPLTPSSRRISALVFAILLFRRSKSALLVTGMTCGAKKKQTQQNVAMLEVIKVHARNLHL